MFVNFASAAFYGTASIGNMLNSVDDSTIVLGAIFLIVFVLVFVSLEKFFKGNKPVAGAIAFAVALLVIWGTNRSGFSYTNIFYGAFFFLPPGFLESVWPFLVLGLFIFAIIKFGVRGPGYFMIIAGVMLFFLSMIGVFYEFGATVGISFFLFVIGIAWILVARKLGFKSKHETVEEAMARAGVG